MTSALLILDESKLGPLPKAKPADEEYAKNNLPDARARWKDGDGKARGSAHPRAVLDGGLRLRLDWAACQRSAWTEVALRSCGLNHN